jgi:hypothetical protein
VTEAELKAHRKEQADLLRAEAERNADKVAWSIPTASIEVVDRGTAVNDRAAHRAWVAEMVALRLTGATIKEIAKEVQADEVTVRKYLALAAQTAERNDVGILLDHHAVPLAVDNLIEGLRAGDKQYTLKVLEGRGHFQKHSRGQTAVASRGTFQFEWKGAPQAMAALPEGSIQGIERGQTIDAEVIEDDK